MQANIKKTVAKTQLGPTVAFTPLDPDPNATEGEMQANIKTLVRKRLGPTVNLTPLDPQPTSTVAVPRKPKPSAPKLPMETIRRMVHLAHPDNARPIDARWQIARAFVDRLATRHNFRRVFDNYVKLAVTYIKFSDSCKSEKDIAKLAKRMPHLHAAYVLRHSNDKLQRGLVEARLVAGLSVEQTAVACNLPPETVEWYEALFFRVVGLLEHRLYILGNVFGWKFYGGATEADVDFMVKRAGFAKGPLMVDLFEKYYAFDWRVVANVHLLDEEGLKELISMIQLKMLILTWILPIEKMNAVFKLSALNGQLQELVNDFANNKALDRPLDFALSLLQMADSVGKAASVAEFHRVDEAIDAVA